MTRLPPPSARFTKSPTFKEPGLTRHFDQIVVDMTRELGSRATRTEAVSEVLMMSPGGKVFRVSVDDTGALVTSELAS